MSTAEIKTSLNNDKSQTKKLIAIAIPMMIQNGVSNFVNLLDNLMIGRVGGNALSGVALANQIIFVYFLMIFGATAGVGIFTAQYHGKGDNEGIRYTFRFKIIMNTVIASICTLVLAFSMRYLISLFLQGEGDPAIDALVMQRYEAKKAKNFAEADRIRDELKAQGVEITDVKGGAVWKRA